MDNLRNFMCNCTKNLAVSVFLPITMKRRNIWGIQSKNEDPHRSDSASWLLMDGVANKLTPRWSFGFFFVVRSLWVTPTLRAVQVGRSRINTGWMHSIGMWGFQLFPAGFTGYFRKRADSPATFPPRIYFSSEKAGSLKGSPTDPLLLVINDGLII